MKDTNDTLADMMLEVVTVLLPMMWGKLRDGSPSFYSAVATLADVIEKAELPTLTEKQRRLLMDEVEDLYVRLYKLREVQDGDDADE